MISTSTLSRGDIVRIGEGPNAYEARYQGPADIEILGGHALTPEERSAKISKMGCTKATEKMSFEEGMNYLFANSGNVTVYKYVRLCEEYGLDTSIEPLYVKVNGLGRLVHPEMASKV